MKKSMKKLIPCAAFALAFAGCGQDASKLVFRQAPVVRTGLVRTVDATGKVTPKNSSEGIPVGAQVTGKLVKLFVDYNSSVTNGQLVALIDPTTYQAAYDRAVATLAAAEADVGVKEAAVVIAEATYALACKSYERNRKLVEKSLAAVSDFDEALKERDAQAGNVKSAKSAVQSAKAVVMQCRADVVNAKANLDYCSIRSPVDGTVIARKIEEGETVVSTYNTTPILTIAEDLRTVWIETTVPEADVGGVKVGQKVTFTADAYSRKFAGTVKQIRRAANKTNNVVTFPVIVEAENPDEMLFPGMTATISIETGRVADAPVVTVAALRFEPKAEERTAAGVEGKTVWIANAEGKLDPVAVKPGLSDDSFIVLEGADDLVGKNVVVGYQSAGASKDDELNNPFMPKQKSADESEM